MVIAIVVRMLFGNLTESTMQKFLRCSETYTKASDRWSVHLRAHFQTEFNSEEVHGATLITDASNTRNKEVELVVITFVEHNSSGQRQLLRSVDLLAAASKKSSIMADTVMTTVCQCIGTSVHKVDSMITDAASNAVTEAKKLTALIDAEVVSRGRGCAPD